MSAPPSGSAHETGYPWRVGAALLAAVLLVAGVFYAFAWQAPIPSAGVDNSASSVGAPPIQAPPAATLSRVPDAEPAQTGIATTTSQQAADAVDPATAASGPAGAAAAAPGTPGQVVGDAYLRYFKVRALATYYLDPTLLPAVAADQALAGLRQSIEASRAQHRALRTNVEHHYRVSNVQTDTADVVDNYRDMSVWVDATTLQPLPGQVAPASPDVAPEVRAVYHLQRMDGVWKVVGGERQ